MRSGVTGQDTDKRQNDAVGSSLEHPGDEAPPGTPGTGEAVCRDCHGTGQVAGRPCQACDGTGKVIQGIGGA